MAKTKLEANIPSDKKFFVDDKGRIYNHLGRELKGKPNANSDTLRSLDFLDKEGKRKAQSFQRIIWNTFYPDDMVTKEEVVLLKNPKLKHPFSLDNLYKVNRKSTVNLLNERRLIVYAERRAKGIPPKKSQRKPAQKKQPKNKGLEE